MSIDELKEFIIPFSWMIPYTGILHGVASWFDITLGDRVLSTCPNLERTHWHQIRLLLREPLAVNSGSIIDGQIHFKVNNMRSYNINLELKNGENIRKGTYYLHEQTYFFDTPNLQADLKPEMVGLYEDLNQI